VEADAQMIEDAYRSALTCLRHTGCSESGNPPRWRRSAFPVVAQIEVRWATVYRYDPGEAGPCCSVTYLHASSDAAVLEVTRPAAAIHESSTTAASRRSMLGSLPRRCSGFHLFGVRVRIPARTLAQGD
jgi:hypothetical protein